LKRAKAVILDVRKNGGGNSDHGCAIGNHFISGTVEASKWKTRDQIKTK
jgi:C-terminal processing protease CtpA/Prc